MKGPVLQNVGFVVKMPGGIKGVGIDGQNNDKNCENRKDIPAAWRKVHLGIWSQRSSWFFSPLFRGHSLLTLTLLENTQGFVRMLLWHYKELLNYLPFIVVAVACFF